MTEESFQQCRKVMQVANHTRGMITTALESVRKWESLLDYHKKKGTLDLSKIEAKLSKSYENLQKWKDKFASLEFPDSNIKERQKTRKPCKGCTEDCYNFQMHDCK